MDTKYTTRAINNINKIYAYELAESFKARQLKINVKYLKKISKMQESLKNLTNDFKNHEVDEVAYKEEKAELESKLEQELEAQEKQIEMAATAEMLKELDKEKYRLENLKQQEQAILEPQNKKQAKIPRFIKNIFRKVTEAYRYSIGYDLKKLGEKIKNFGTMPKEYMSPEREEQVDIETPTVVSDDINKRLEELGKIIQEKAELEKQNVKMNDMSQQELKDFVDKNNRKNPTKTQNFKNKFDKAKANKEKASEKEFENENINPDPTANVNETKDVDTVEYDNFKKEEEIVKEQEETKEQDEKHEKVEEAKKEASIFTDWAQYEQKSKEDEAKKQQILSDLNKLTPNHELSHIDKNYAQTPIEVGAALKPFLEQEETKEAIKKNEESPYTDKEIIEAFNELGQNKNATVEDYKALTNEIRRVNFKDEIEEKKNEIYTDMITKEEEINKDNSQLAFNLFDSHSEDLKNLAEKQALESIDALTK